MTNEEIIEFLESKGFYQFSGNIYRLDSPKGFWIMSVRPGSKFRLTNDNPNFEVVGRIDSLEFLDRLLLDLGVYS